MRDKARRWGISTAYEDTSGTIIESPESSLEAILNAMGAEANAPPAKSSVLVVTAGEGARVDFSGTLTLEDGPELHVDERLPESLPLGYHRLVGKRDSIRVIVTPPAAPLPPADCRWGWQVQLHSMRSRSSWGFGDLADLRELTQCSADLGASFVLINPLHAPAPTIPQSASPYYPSSRLFRNPLYLRIEDVPGAAGLSELDRLAAAGRALNADRRIDRDGVFRLKSEALNLMWSRFQGDPSFDDYCSAQGQVLRTYSTYCVLAEEFGASWRTWPEEYRSPFAPGVVSFAKERTERIRFHQWVQWLVDQQQTKAAGDTTLIADLALGFDPGGADAWMWQDVIAEDMSVGAPPDEFNMQGQDWGIPPFDPWKLRAACYEPFIQTIRAALRGAAGLRVDHVMGLARLFWIPAGAGPEVGAYVRYPLQDLLGILALESRRAGAFVIGEDLGTVEPELRKELARRSVLSQRVLILEPGKPADYPEHALSSVTTHDLPTVAGLWTGSDLTKQKELGLIPNEASTYALRERIGRETGLAEDAPVADVVLRTYELLSAAPCMLAASLEDVIGVEERPNMPGTLAASNWSLALPLCLEEIRELPLVQRIAAALQAPLG